MFPDLRFIYNFETEAKDAPVFAKLAEEMPHVIFVKVSPALLTIAHLISLS